MSSITEVLGGIPRPRPVKEAFWAFRHPNGYVRLHLDTKNPKTREFEEKSAAAYEIAVATARVKAGHLADQVTNVRVFQDKYTFKLGADGPLNTIRMRDVTSPLLPIIQDGTKSETFRNTAHSIADEIENLPSGSDDLHNRIEVKRTLGAMDAQFRTLAEQAFIAARVDPTICAIVIDRVVQTTKQKVEKEIHDNPRADIATYIENTITQETANSLNNQMEEIRILGSELLNMIPEQPNQSPNPTYTPFQTPTPAWEGFKSKSPEDFFDRHFDEFIRLPQTTDPENAFYHILATISFHDQLLEELGKHEKIWKDKKTTLENKDRNDVEDMQLKALEQQLRELEELKKKLKINHHDALYLAAGNIPQDRNLEELARTNPRELERVAIRIADGMNGFLQRIPANREERGWFDRKFNLQPAKKPETLDAVQKDNIPNYANETGELVLCGGNKPNDGDERPLKEVAEAFILYHIGNRDLNGARVEDSMQILGSFSQNTQNALKDSIRIAYEQTENCLDNLNREFLDTAWQKRRDQFKTHEDTAKAAAEAARARGPAAPAPLSTDDDGAAGFVAIGSDSD